MANYLTSLIDWRAANMTHAMVRARLRIRKLIRLIKAYKSSTKMEAKSRGGGAKIEKRISFNHFKFVFKRWRLMNIRIFFKTDFNLLGFFSCFLAAEKARKWIHFKHLHASPGKNLLDKKWRIPLSRAVMLINQPRPVSLLLVKGWNSSLLS